MAEEKPVIQYVITFPPDSENGTYEEDSFSVVETSEGRRPVIILLGWAGCIDRHLAKYSEMYEKKRYITIRYTAPTDALFYKLGKLGELAEQVLELLYQHQLEQNPIFFHIFSNGGCFVYRFAAEFIRSKARFSDLNVRGCIIDSAPGKRRILNAAKAFAMTLKLNCFLRYALGFCLLIYLAITRLIVQLFWRGSQIGSSFFLFEALSADLNMWPQLCLYSKADEIILSQDVEAYIASRRQLGVDVDSICWENSAHVAHFRDHREVYIQKCLDFVSKHLPQRSQK